MIELIGWIAVFGIWVFTVANYLELPEIIPIHYNEVVAADSFGNKSNILALPITSSLLFIGLTILNKRPNVFNYPSEITKENALFQYTNATRMIRFLKIIVMIIFGWIVFKTIQNVNGNTDGLGPWCLPLTMAMIFIPIIYFMMNTSKKKKTTE